MFCDWSSRFHLRECRFRISVIFFYFHDLGSGNLSRQVKFTPLYKPDLADHDYILATLLCHRSLLYEMLLIKLRPLHLKGSDFGTVGGLHRIALAPGILMSDYVVLFIWLTVSTSLPEFRYGLTWFLIVAAFQ